MFAQPKQTPAKIAAGKAEQPARNVEISSENNPLWQALALNVAAIQTKLSVSQPDDPDEQEADRVAERVIRMPASPLGAQQPPSPANRKRPNAPIASSALRKRNRRDEEDSLHVNESGDPAPLGSVLPAVRWALNSPGHQLDSSTLNFMEERFDQSFGNVRVHIDGLAAESARAINALAFTSGRDIFFGAGQYQPHSDSGRRLLAHELTHVAQQTSGGPSAAGASVIQRVPDGDQPKPLIISAATFQEAAQNFAQLLQSESITDPARIVVINGPNARVFNESGQPAAQTAFHLHTPVQVPAGVFRPVPGQRQYHVILRLPDGSYTVGGRVAISGDLDLQHSFDQQEAYDQAVAGVNIVYIVSPQSTVIAPTADAPQTPPPEQLPEFMQFVSTGQANMPAWPAAVMPVTPQLATINSTGTYICQIEKNQGVNTLDRVTNLMQRTSFRWEVLKLDPQLRVAATRDATRWQGVREGYARRLRDLEADRQTILGEQRQRQSIPERVARTYFAEQMTQTRTILAMAGQTLMTVVNAVTGGTNQLSTEDTIDVPWREEGDYFVRCLATPVSDPSAPNRRATSVAGLMVSVFNIETVARESIPTVESEREQMTRGVAAAQAELARRERLQSEGQGDQATLDVEYTLASLRVDYEQALLAAVGDERARKNADLAYVRAQLRYLTGPTVPHGSPQLNRQISERIRQLREQEGSQAGLLARVEGRLGSGVTYRATMRAVLVDEWTSARSELTFSIGENTRLNTNELEVRIVDITAPTGRAFTGTGTGWQGEGRREAWQLALRDLRRNLGRGRGFLSYRVPPPYSVFASETPNPMQLQIAEIDQLREAVDDAAHAMTLAALIAAPFTGGASLSVLAVLAPIQAGSSLYNIVNRAMYDDLRVDADSISSFIDVATLGLGRVGQAGRFATRTVQIVATSSRVAVRLLDGGAFVVMTWQAYHEMTREIPGEDPAARSRRRLLALLQLLEGASIPVAGHLWPGGHSPSQQPPRTLTTGEPVPHMPPRPGELPPPRPTDQPVPREPSTAGGGAQPATGAGGAARVPATATQTAGLSGHFRDKVFVDDSLGDHDAKVNYRVGADGLITDVHIAVGLLASASDIRSHVPTAELMLRYSGFNGRLRVLVEQISNWFRARGAEAPPVGSRAWEARLELEKLQRMMAERSSELQRGGMDDARRDQLMDELDNLQTQLIEHAATLDSLDLSPGRGYVAASGVASGREIARQRGYPDPPAGYVWRYRRGQLEVVAQGEGLAKRYFDESAFQRAGATAAEIFPPDTRSREEPQFEAGTTRHQAFRDLGGHDSTSEFGSFVEMLRREGLISSTDDVIRIMQAPENLTWRTVRHNVKRPFIEQLITRLGDSSRLRQTSTYQTVLRATGNPAQARRAASHVEMIRVTRGLGSADRGSIGERWYMEMYGSRTSETQVSVPRETMRQQGREIAEDRNLDVVEGGTARELKNVSDTMGPRERRQIVDLIAMLGGNVTVRGRPRRLERLVETFLDPRGALANRDFMLDVFRTYPNAEITFELYTTTGVLIPVTRANRDTLSIGLAERLGLSSAGATP